MTREQWLASTEALLALDAKGALVPHGIGGHARTLLEEAVRHLSAVPDGEGELIERLKPNAIVDHVPGLAVSELRAAGFGDLAERLNAWIVRNNALKSEASITLSQAYERGQVDMRERAAVKCERMLVFADTTSGADKAISTAIRSLPIDSAGKDARTKAEQIMRDALGRIALLDQYEVVDDTSPYERTAKCMGQLAIIALDALNKADAGKDA